MGLKIHGLVTYITIYDITLFWIRWDDMMFNIWGEAFKTMCVNVIFNRSWTCINYFCYTVS